MDKKQKLLNRPVEADTLIIDSMLVDFKAFIGLVEAWSWDGINGNSAIFLVEDVAHMSEDELKQFYFEEVQFPNDPKATFTKRGDYVFINYNFQV